MVNQSLLISLTSNYMTKVKNCGSSTLKNLGLIIIAVAISYVSSEYFGQLYMKVTNDPGTFVDTRSLIGLPLSYIFFLTVLLTVFGGNKKYVWLGILLIPAAAFELYFDLDHIYFPLLLGLAGWSIGIGFARLIKLMS